LVKTLGSPTELGYYAMALGIVNTLLIAPSAVTMAMFPTLARRFSEGEATRHRLSDSMLRTSLLLAVPLSGGALLFSDHVLVSWVGVQYAPASTVIRVLAAAMTASALSFVLRVVLFAADRPGRDSLISLAGSVGMLAVGIPLWQGWKGIGLAAGYLAMEWVLIIARTFAARPVIGRPAYGRALLRILLATALPAGLVTVLVDWPFAAQVGVYVIGVMGLSWALKAWPLELRSFAEAAVNGSRLLPGHVSSGFRALVVSRGDVPDRRGP
jgi:O-antigen/teichoic acid export membrane protein